MADLLEEDFSLAAKDNLYRVVDNLLAAAQIVFCKSSGGQAEGEMDGSMLR